MIKSNNQLLGDANTIASKIWVYHIPGKFNITSRCAGRTLFKGLLKLSVLSFMDGGTSADTADP